MKDLVLLISGASGIAAATAMLARAAGARVFTVALSGADLDGDLSDPAVANWAAAGCVARFGRIDALFNVAGISGRRFGDGPVHECTDDGWRHTLANNLTSMFLLSRAVLCQMLSQEPRGHGARGSIVNMTSVLAFSPEPTHFATHAYAASKGAIIALTTSMASFYARHGIRVNAVAPGLARTPMSERAQSNPAILEFMRHKQQLAGTLLESADVARAALFLLSDDSRMITGEVLPVDAGWHVSA
jgi:NAD(P)-dependent dehydrogenase (short-subunit alcohol dehydrogenase family)